MRVGMEATGYSRWLERLLAELGFELWIGDPAEIKAKRVKKQKNDRNDARLLRRLMPVTRVDSIGRRNTISKFYLQEFQRRSSFASVDSKESHDHERQIVKWG